MAVVPVNNNFQKIDFGRAFLICLWFGIVAGLGERIFYHFFPGTSPPDGLWYGALCCLIIFASLAVPLLLWQFLVKRGGVLAAIFFSSALLAVDWLTIAIPSRGRALQLILAALFIAAIITFLFAHFERAFFYFGKLTLLPLAIYLAAYLIWTPLWSHHLERRQLAALPSNHASPNVVLIIVDALRADHLSTYGYSRPTSPHLTEMAAHGVLFENAIAPSSWTLPSHASMLTGRYPDEHHAGQNDWRLVHRFPLAGEAFERAGYRTAAFSGNPFLFTRRVGFGPGYMHFEDGSWLHKLSEANLGARIHNLLARMHLLHDVLGRQDARTITTHALHWIDSSSQPFFITMNLFDVHEPFMPPPEYFHRFSQRTKPLDQFYWPQDVQLSPQQIQDEIDAYDGCIAYTDDQIAAFMGQLRRRGVLDHTIVIVTSDHGEEFQEHGFMFHGKGLYWELIHAPLILYAPGNAAVPPGARIVTPVALQSLPATMLHLARTSANSFPGPSLDPLWSARSPANWPYPVSELASFGTSPLFPSYFGPMKSIVTAKWHYIEGGKFGEELYPCCGNEVSNQAASAGGKLMAQDLRQILGSTESPRVGIAASAIQQNVPARPVLNPKQLAADRQKMNDQLRALGYTPDLL